VDILGEEFLALINTFERNQLKYIIVGGFATYYHGYQRTTGDIDFWLKDDLENRAKLVESLDQMLYGRMEELLSVPFIAGYCEVMLDNGVYADFMNSILGFEQEDFDDSYHKATVTEINGISIRFLHMNDLIKSKESSSRPKDIDDAEQLKKIKDSNS
jgi:hypothetical protein